MDKFTIIRSVDASHSNHEPDQVFQTGSLEAAPASTPMAGSTRPSVRSSPRCAAAIIPACRRMSLSCVRVRTWLLPASSGRQYDPFLAGQATRLPIYDLVGNDTGSMTQADLFSLPLGITHERIHERRRLLQAFDQMRSDLDHTGMMDAMDRYGQQAVNMLIGGRAQAAFDIEREPRPSATATAGISGVSKRSSPAGWSRRARPSSPST